MSTIKEIVISLMFCAISIAFCELLIPKESFKNQMRLITGAVFLICLISPFINGIEIKEFEISGADLEYDINYSAKRSVAYAAKNEVVTILKNNNVYNAKITVNTSNDENNSIILESIIILFDEKDKSVSKSITDQVKEKLEVECKREFYK